MTLALFPAAETYDLAVAGPDAWAHFLADAPLAEQARKDVSPSVAGKEERLSSGTPMPNRKKARLARISYAQFLTELAGVHADVIRLYQTIFSASVWRRH